ncbi:MAG: site-2 protease family protein [Burkholderiales bacterium]|nr:site-2 protease family protein [Phycisphaerae bacterium]
MFESTLNILLVALAFGFVIFWHELGHFLAARWAGVRVEQFAVGMGHALFSYRRGIGFRFGNTREEFEKRTAAEFAKRQGELTGRDQPREATLREQYDIARDLGIGETEYRLSWIPLGGYVKPTGQDDLRPAKEVAADDPHAFGAKSVGKRMVIISAGVVMNVILAFALYVLLFVYGFNSSPTVIGLVQSGSPAQLGGLRVGDRIESINGEPQEDYTKITMNVALLRDDEPARFVVKRPGVEQPVTLMIKPVKSAGTANMPGIGVMGAFSLTGADKRGRGELITAHDALLPIDAVITTINGMAVKADDYHVLDQALQTSAGQPVELVIRKTDGSVTTHSIMPTLFLGGAFSGETDLSIAGLRPRVQINGIKKDSVAQKNGVRPGDVIQEIGIVETGEVLAPPSTAKFLEWVNSSGKADRAVRLVLTNGGAAREVTLKPTDKTERGRGMGVTRDYETAATIVADVAPDSPAAKAGVRPGERIVSIGGENVATWFDIVQKLRASKSGDIKIVTDGVAGTRELTMSIDAASAKMLADVHYSHSLPLAPLIEPRKTRDPLTLVEWSINETKYSIFQVYATLQRLFQGSVPVSNLSGPLGILSAGSSAADRGLDWLIWFTALISANLAVVNFLPIPIVDGGLFIFLLAEKLTGRPPSPRVQAVAQIVGLVLLGSLFLFVTYHDVLRQWG